MALKENPFADLDEYTAYRIRQDQGISMEEAIQKNKEQIAKNIIPYDKNRFGELPEYLKSQTIP
jgi:uncharacterized protein YegL